MAGGDQKKARDLLKNKDNKIRQEDAIKISFYGGSTLILVLFAIILLVVIHLNSITKNIDFLNLPLQIFRATFIFIYIVFATAFCV